MEREEKILMIYVNHDNKIAEVKNISSEAKIYCFLYRNRCHEGRQIELFSVMEKFLRLTLNAVLANNFVKHIP